MHDGYVALLDVLGFSTLVGSLDNERRLNRYLQCITDVIGARTDVEFVVFSDTILLTTKDESDSALRALLERCSALFGSMLEADIPIRGAIAHGPFVRAETGAGVFIAGRPVVEAFRFEQQQDWVGIMLAPSTVRRVPDLRLRCDLGGSWTHERVSKFRENLGWSAFVQSCHGIPFHAASEFSNDRYDGYAVTPTSGVVEPTAVVDSLFRSLEGLARLRAVAPDPAAQRKYRESQDWLYRVHQQWQSFARFLAETDKQPPGP